MCETGVVEVYRVTKRVELGVKATEVCCEKLQQLLKDISRVWNNLMGFMSLSNLAVRHTHCHTHTRCHIHTLSHTHTVTHTHCHIHTYTVTYTHTQSHTHTLRHIHTHTLQSHTHTRSYTNTLSLSHTSLTHKVSFTGMSQNGFSI